MSKTTRNKRKSKELSSQIVIESAKETDDGLGVIYKALQIYQAQTNPIIEQALRTIEYQNSLILNGLVSPNILKIIEAQGNLFDYEKVLLPPPLEIVNSVNVSIGHLLESTYSQQITDFAKLSEQLSKDWSCQLASLEKALMITEPYRLVMQSHIAEIAQLSAISQASLSNLDWGQMGSALDITASARKLLQSSFTDFAQSYQQVFSWLERQPLSLLSLPPELSRFPSVEFFNGVEVVDAVTLKPSDYDIKLQQEKQQVDEDIKAETADKLNTFLINLNRDLLIPLDGARQSLTSENPDRARHLSTSLRELITHILYILAPDEKIKEWIDDPQYLDNKGKPTRRARLFYICRNINQAPFSRFVEKDVDAALEFLQLFQRGTHEVVPNYTDAQLKTMLLRMESLLRYLLELADMDRTVHN